MYIAGSAGDPQAAQLIIDNRSTTIEYARPQSSSSAMTDSYHGHSHGSLARVVRSDWSCESVRLRFFLVQCISLTIALLSLIVWVP